MSAIGIILLAIVVAWLWLAIMAMIGARVSRSRVERFASRQALPITIDNGNLVIRYLATTRRWRAGGLITATVIFTVWSAHHGRFSINTFELFGGWFIGAVIAEWRVAAAATGSRRSAQLVPRRTRDYLRPPARVLPTVAFVICAAVAVADAGGALAGRHAVWRHLVPWVVVTAAGLALVYVVQRHVLRRPQPVVSRDVLAADVAIRARSLQVLAGSAVAAAGIPAAALIHTLHIAYPSLGTDGTNALSSLTFLIAVVVGWVLGLAPVRSAAPVEPAAMSPAS
jgi:hypothetical protein